MYCLFRFWAVSILLPLKKLVWLKPTSMGMFYFPLLHLWLGPSLARWFVGLCPKSWFVLSKNTGYMGEKESWVEMVMIMNHKLVACVCPVTGHRKCRYLLKLNVQIHRGPLYSVWSFFQLRFVFEFDHNVIKGKVMNGLQSENSTR